jgi:hypothetical protein
VDRIPGLGTASNLYAPSPLEARFRLPLDEPEPELAADAYLRGVLAREAVDTGRDSRVREAQAELMPVLQRWGEQNLLAVYPSGSFAKGTANQSGTHIDLFLSLSWDTDASLLAIHDGLERVLRAWGYQVQRQEVSLRTRVHGYEVDLVPGKQLNADSADHSLYLRRRETTVKTNVLQQVWWALETNRQEEMRLVKLWRTQRALDWPSYYVELAAARALGGAPRGKLWRNFRTVMEFARDELQRAQLVDPANRENVVSDSMTTEEKRTVAWEAAVALRELDWHSVVA